MVDKRFSALAAGILTVTLIGSSAGIAHAAPLAEEERAAALWSADRLKFDELQAHGATGEGIKIAVIDAAINPDVAELQGANVTVMGSYCVFRDTGNDTPPTQVNTNAEVTFVAGEGITGIHLTMQATVPGLEEGDFQRIAEEAKNGCPVSQALKAVNITLTATLN